MASPDLDHIREVALFHRNSRRAVKATDGEAHEFDRRRTSDPNKLNLVTLHARHQRMVSMHCDGMTAKAIAERLGVTPLTVNNALNSELCKIAIEEEIGRRQGAKDVVEAQITSAASEAVQIMEQAMRGTLEVQVVGEDGEMQTVVQVVPPAQRLKAAETFLDRTQGTAKVQRVYQEHSGLLPEDALEALKARFASVVEERKSPTPTDTEVEVDRSSGETVEVSDTQVEDITLSGGTASPPEGFAEGVEEGQPSSAEEEVEGDNEQVPSSAVEEDVGGHSEAPQPAHG